MTLLERPSQPPSRACDREKRGSKYRGSCYPRGRMVMCKTVILIPERSLRENGLLVHRLPTRTFLDGTCVSLRGFLSWESKTQSKKADLFPHRCMEGSVGRQTRHVNLMQAPPRLRDDASGQESPLLLRGCPLLWYFLFTRCVPLRLSSVFHDCATCSPIR